MGIQLAFLLVCCTWPTIIDGDEEDENCRYGYYTHNGEYEEYFISCGSKDYCCRDLMDRACCPTSDNYSDDNDETPTVGLMFGSIAACTTFIILCACICGKMGRRQRPSSDPERPYTAQPNPSTVGGPPLTTLQNQRPGSIATVQTSPPSNQTRDATSSPPPSYEECLEKNLILPPPAYDIVSSFTNHAFSDSGHNVPTNTGHSEHNSSTTSSE
ncbi:uncharacterized protein LOC117331586 [Pecten maximus]|uniref:uncharacterized protein LOC117331586 n=1 Tax=Pecten maximus TaxID=6579 RepID=UPI0014582438|nr:uncharacterized protein LOC117331586 [Pecten maximus]